MIFIRRTTFANNRLRADVFGPYDDRDEAVADCQAWAESTSIPLESGLPFPDCSFWAEGGSILLFIEPGQGNPGRKISE